MKTKKRKTLLVTALLIALLMMASACANTTTPDDTSPSETVTSSTATEAIVPDVTEPETTEPETTEPDESSPPSGDKVELNIVGLKGPTSMGLAPLVLSAADGEETFDISFSVVGAPTDVAPLIVKGEADLAAVPANLASVLYNKTEGGISVVSVNTLGVLNIVERGEEVTTLADLKGKTVYASGQGAVPEYVFNMLLEKEGLDPSSDLDIEWLAEHTEVVSNLAANDGSAALLPQPFVTVAQQQLEDLRVAIDLNTVWESNMGDAGLIMGVLVARNEVIEAHPEAVADFVKRYEQSIAFVNDNPEDASKMIEQLDIFKAAIAQKAIPHCHIHFMTGEPMKTSLSGFLDLLYDVDPKSVGGELPPDDFYYSPNR
ncbi:MAG: ABC transporter substrate-binding protein [Clostridiaceae bacterium]|jgi:NitT/TauT family transport system substrate-binding protein|nr:ABC transporter substrate-binding protein [Clostridiaceae bacterium]